MNDSPEVRIAVVETKIEGLREQNKAQYDSLKSEVYLIKDDIKSLIAVMNRGKGAYTASLLLAGTLGTGILAGVQWLLSFVKH
jgi:hypothetical protein